MTALLEEIHPGEILLEDFIKPMGISARQLAADIDVSPSRISELVDGIRPITADTALRLGIFFSMEPRFWLNLPDRIRHADGYSQSAKENRPAYSCTEATVRPMKPPSNLEACALFLLVAIFATGVNAQSYPSKPIRLVLGFAPGGAADYVSRIISEPLGRALGQTIVVENRAGAGSTIAADFVAHSPPDGYTILIASPSAISVNPALNPKLGYKPSDLVPVTKVSASPQVVAVNPSTGITSIKELIALSKKEPGKLNYATSGNGSAPHMATILFTRLTSTEMVHIPYKSGGLAVQSVLAGDTQVTFATPPSVLPFVKAGRLRAIAVTSRARSPLVPDLPGMEESGVADYDMSLWYGFFVPVGTPPDVIKKIFDATIAALREPQVKEAFGREGTETAPSKSPEDFAAFLAEDAKLMVRLVKESGAKID